MWYVDLDRNFVLQKLYDDVPELTKIEIGAIKLENAGRRISIHFELPVYANHPPQNWIDSGYNTVYVIMNFVDIQELSVHSQQPPYHGDITINFDKENLLDIQVHGTVEMSFKAADGMIQEISGYMKDLSRSIYDI